MNREFTIGQDVLVEAPSILNGEAFIASVESRGFGDTLVLNTRENEGLPEQAQAHVSEVLTLTELFDRNA